MHQYPGARWLEWWHTLLDAVLAGLAVVVNLAGDALDALIVVVLGAMALLGVAAL